MRITMPSWSEYTLEKKKAKAWREMAEYLYPQQAMPDDNADKMLKACRELDKS